MRHKNYLENMTGKDHTKHLCIKCIIILKLILKKDFNVADFHKTWLNVSDTGTQYMTFGIVLYPLGFDIRNGAGHKKLFGETS
jgi:hypothetical protein